MSEPNKTDQTDHLKTVPSNEEIPVASDTSSPQTAPNFHTEAAEEKNDTKSESKTSVKNKTAEKAVKTVFVMIVAMVLSKVLGLIRSTLLASHYGTSTAATAFTAASRIPLSFFDMLFSAAILGCFVPVYNSFKSKNNTFDQESEQQADRFACIFFNFIFLLTGILTLLGILFARPLLQLMTPNASPEVLRLATPLMQIMFPMVIFTGTTYTLIGVMQSKDRFIIPSLVSCVSNLAVILYFVFVNDRLGKWGIYGLAVAYLVAWFLQLLTLVIPLLQMHFKFRLLFSLRDPHLRRAIKMTPPIMIGSWLAPVGTLVATRFAGDSVTIFEYSNQLYVIIVGILTYGICNFTFPKLSRMNVLGDDSSFASMARTSLLSAFAMILPIMIGVMILSGEGTAILYFRGEFTSADTANTAAALQLLTIGMPAYCTIEMFNRIMYSKMNVYVPMLGAITGIVINVFFSWLLPNLFPTLNVGALTLANALGQYAAAIVLTVFLLKTTRGILSKKFFLSMAKILLSTILCAIVMLICYHFFAADPTQPTVSMFRNILTVLSVFLPGAVVYLISLKLLKTKMA